MVYKSQKTVSEMVNRWRLLNLNQQLKHFVESGRDSLVAPEDGKKLKDGELLNVDKKGGLCCCKREISRSWSPLTSSMIDILSSIAKRACKLLQLYLLVGNNCSEGICVMHCLSLFTG
ncbi:hypothetical protein Ancab_003138 [Ancistrocladus abbreviatus]